MLEDDMSINDAVGNGVSRLEVIGVGIKIDEVMSSEIEDDNDEMVGTKTVLLVGIEDEVSGT